MCVLAGMMRRSGIFPRARQNYGREFSRGMSVIWLMFRKDFSSPTAENGLEGGKNENKEISWEVSVGWDKMVSLMFKGREQFRDVFWRNSISTLETNNLKSSHLVVHMIMCHFHPLEGNSGAQGSCFPYWSPYPQPPSHASHRERTVILSTVHQALWIKSHHRAGWVWKLHSAKWAYCSVKIYLCFWSLNTGCIQ